MTTEEREEKIRALANAKFQTESDGDVNIDADAVVSEGGANGAYVAAWVWVDFEGYGVRQEL